MILLSGCTTVRFVDHDEATNAKINERMEGKEVSVVLRNKETVRVDALNVRPDSISWIDPKRALRVVPRSEVKEFFIKHHGEGALEGLFLGLLCGAGIGKLLAGGETGEFAGVFRFFAIAGGGAIGAVAGLIIGAVKGSKEKYVLNP